MLWQLTMDNKNQQRRLDMLEHLIEKKFKELEETIKLRRVKGFQASLVVIETDEGKKIMDSIWGVIDEIETEENQLLRERDEAADANARRTIIIIICGSLLAFGFVAIASFIINQDIVKLREAEEALQKAYEELENRIRERTVELAKANEELRVEIAEHKRTDAKLEESLVEVEKSHENVSSILNQLHLGTIKTDKDGHILFMSRIAQQLLAVGEKEFAGKHWEQLFPLNKRDKLQLKALSE